MEESRRLLQKGTIKWEDAVKTMAEIRDGNDEKSYSENAVTFMIGELLKNKEKREAMRDLICLDKMGVYGEDIYIFWEKVCLKQIKLFNQIMDAFMRKKVKGEAIIKIIQENKTE